MAALVWCCLGLTAHWVFARWACGEDTSYCAESHVKNGVYRGVLTDPQGRAVTNTSFTVEFKSRQASSPRVVDGFATDAKGNYCIVWAEEGGAPFLSVNRRLGTSLYRWTPLNGAPPPHACQPGNQGIPWNHAYGIESTPQFVSVVVFGIVSALLLLVGLALPAFAVAGLTLTIATTALGAILWLS